MQQIVRVRRGDTIIEVLVAITIFSIVSVSSMAVINQGMKHAQVALEMTMVRNEIDAQAEALRFIHNSYSSDRDFSISDQEYSKIWQSLEGDQEVKPVAFNQKDCKEAVEEARKKKNTFVINTRTLRKKNTNDKLVETENKIIFLQNSDEKIFSTAPLYPRIIYSQTATKDENNSDKKILENIEVDEANEMPKPFENIAKVEGIWVQGVPQNMQNNELKEPEFFDFHIRACWHSAGNITPTTMGTILRLYNPRYAEKGAKHV